MWHTDLPPQNPPAIITTTNSNSAIYGPNGTTIWIGDSPVRTSDGTAEPLRVPAEYEEPFKIDWSRQISSPPQFWPQPGIQPLPVVTVPNIQPQPGMTFDELLRLVQALQSGNINSLPPEEKKVEEVEEEEAKPVEKKYGRVLEP